jgi:membrane glycosyltransferase
VSLSLALWMLPVILGLALAIPLALWTGTRRATGVLRTPEDVDPPPVVARAAALLSEWEAMAPPDVAGLLREPRLLAAHAAMLPPPRRPRIDPLDATLLLARTKIEEAETLEAALQALNTTELAVALGDAVALDSLIGMANPAQAMQPSARNADDRAQPQTR